MIAYIGLAALGVLAYAILWREGMLQKNSRVLCSAGLIFLAMVLRLLCMGHETLDYTTFLQPWVEYFRQNGGFLGFRNSVGNYNYPYLYVLALFSYLPWPDLYLIKLFSVLFDVLLAWAALRIARRVTGSDGAGLTAFLLMLLLPTVILNGAYWGQCDSVYGALALWSVAFALEDKPVRSVAAIGLSFAVKPQALYLAPVLLIFLYAGKLKWYHIPIFPLAYVLAILPAVALGRPFLDAMTVYLEQAGTVGDGLNYNSPSVFSFFPWEPANKSDLVLSGYIAAFAFLLLIFIVCSLCRERLNDRILLICSALIAVGVPYFLPHMHDRYFFLADVLSLTLAVCVPVMAFAAVGVSWGSLLGYHAFLRMRYLYPMSYGAAALAVVIAALFLLLLRELTPEEGKKKAGQPVPALADGVAPVPRRAAVEVERRRAAARPRRDASLSSARARARRRERERR